MLRILQTIGILGFLLGGPQAHSVCSLALPDDVVYVASDPKETCWMEEEMRLDEVCFRSFCYDYDTCEVTPLVGELCLSVDRPPS